MPIELIEDLDLERIYRIDTGEEISIIFDDYNYEITFRQNDRDITNSGFSFKDLDSDEEGCGYNERFLITAMQSPFPQMGLGEMALHLFIDMTGAELYVRAQDGQKYDDGSHLTNDAPFFVSKMQKKGLISTKEL